MFLPLQCTLLYQLNDLVVSATVYIQTSIKCLFAMYTDALMAYILVRFGALLEGKDYILP